MTPWGELQFLKNEPKPYFYPHYWVHAGKKKLGIIVGRKEFKGKWQPEPSLLESLIFQSPTIYQLMFDDLDQAKYQISRAYDLMQRSKALADFYREENTKDYLVFYHGLQIGKIVRKYSSEPIPRPDLYDTGHVGRIYARFPRNGRRNHFWLLSEELCRFLRIPYDTQPNSISLYAIRNFICMRLLHNVQDIDLESLKEFQLNNRAILNLESIIDCLTCKEQEHRGQWIQGKKEVYP